MPLLSIWEWTPNVYSYTGSGTLTLSGDASIVLVKTVAGDGEAVVSSSTTTSFIPAPVHRDVENGGGGHRGNYAAVEVSTLRRYPDRNDAPPALYEVVGDGNVGIVGQTHYGFYSNPPIIYRYVGRGKSTVHAASATSFIAPPQTFRPICNGLIGIKSNFTYGFAQAPLRHRDSVDELVLLGLPVDATDLVIV